MCVVVLLFVVVVAYCLLFVVYCVLFVDSCRSLLSVAWCLLFGVLVFGLGCLILGVCCCYCVVAWLKHTVCCVLVRWLIVVFDCWLLFVVRGFALVCCCLLLLFVVRCCVSFAVYVFGVVRCVLLCVGNRVLLFVANCLLVVV